MAKKRYEIEFEGRVTIEFDTDSYPWRDLTKEAGLDKFAIELFYDNAILVQYPFVNDAAFDVVDIYQVEAK